MNERKKNRKTVVTVDGFFIEFIVTGVLIIGQDGFQVTTPQPFMQQQPQSQTTNQGPGLRMAQTAPPTQASTPPNTEIKLQAIPQQNINMVS